MLLVIILFLKIYLSAQNYCQSRNYGNGGTVCVCNASYCDTIPRSQRVPPSQFLIYTSNKSGLRFRLSNGTFLSNGNLRDKIFINSAQEYQTILGWGGAFTDATGINMNSMTENIRDTILRSYFSEEGIEYSLCRVPMGGTDFSIRAYSYDDGTVDPNLRNFKLAPEDYNYKIPYIKRALNITNNNLKLFTSTWTAPKWMKTNDRYSGFGFIKEEFYQTWADYFLRFLDDYKKYGINFWGITTGNEPSDILNPKDILEVVGWPSWLMGKWILNNLGPTIRASNHSNIKIMILDDQRIFLPWYIKKALRNDQTRQYIDGIAVHWYLDQYFSPELLDRTHDDFPEKFILGTEASITPQDKGPAVVLGSWSNGEEYSFDIIQDLLHWVTGWIDWNMVLDLKGGPNYINNFVDACIIVNATAGEFYKQPIFYHLGHFSKFVPRGSVRIHSQTRWTENIYAVAFRKPDNGTVVVILNRNKDDVPINIVDRFRGTATLTLSGNSITTILYW